MVKPPPWLSWQGKSDVQSFDLDGVDSIPAIYQCRVPSLLIISITYSDDDVYTANNSVNSAITPFASHGLM